MFDETKNLTLLALKICTPSIERSERRIYRLYATRTRTVSLRYIKVNRLFVVLNATVIVNDIFYPFKYNCLYTIMGIKVRLIVSALFVVGDLVAAATEMNPVFLYALIN